jgi:hypothetical protein
MSEKSEDRYLLLQPEHIRVDIDPMDAILQNVCHPWSSYTEEAMVVLLQTRILKTSLALPEYKVLKKREPGWGEIVSLEGALKLVQGLRPRNLIGENTEPEAVQTARRMERDGLEVAVLLEISTGHMSERDSKKLDSGNVGGLVIYELSEYGWLVWTGLNESFTAAEAAKENGMSDAFQTVLSHATKHNITWVKLFEW